jgi:IS4 transposase
VLVKEFPGIDPIELRRIEMIDPDGGDNLVFLTNIRHLVAKTIAAIYKDRWKIETFFRTIKQNLRIKTFVGTSSNALHTQIWTALIAILILRYLQLKSSFDWSMSNLVALLRFNLFSYRDLWSWINKPFEVPIPPAPCLIQLPLPQFGQQA